MARGLEVSKERSCARRGRAWNACRTLGASILASSFVGAQSDPGEVIGEQKISNVEGNFGGALHENDQFGRSVASLGDLNGDGFTDIAVGAFGDGISQFSDEGAVWILFLAADGTVKSEQRIDNDNGGFSGFLDNDNWFGWAVANVGDLDGDGVVDLAASAPRDDNGTAIDPNQGAIWILFLNTDGTVKTQQKINTEEGGVTGPLPALFGESLAGLGDFDGDGRKELAVGDPRDDTLGMNAGTVWIYDLNSDGTVEDSETATLAELGFGGTLDVAERFGESVAALGDLDGDGVGELAVGAPGHFVSNEKKGALWILFMNGDGTVKAWEQIIKDGPFPVSIPASQGEMGSSVSGLGDVDGDGLTDLAVGEAWERLYLLFLNPDGTVRGGQLIDEEDLIGELDTDNDGLSVSVTSLGDLDGDGFDDLATGAFRDDDGGGANFTSGAVWILFLSGPPPPPFDPLLAALQGKAGLPAYLPDSTEGGFDSGGFVVVPDVTSGSVVTTKIDFDDEGGVDFGPSLVFPTGSIPTQAVAGDFDGRGDVDVVTCDFGDATVSFLPGTGGGTLGGPFESDLVHITKPIGVEAAHFDDDMLLDLAVAGEDGIVVLINNGTGEDFAISSFLPLTLLTDLEAADLDGDEIADIIVATSGAEAFGPGLEVGVANVLHNDGTGNLSYGQLFAPGKAIASVMLGDLDGDLEIDALLTLHEFASVFGGSPQGRIDVYSGDGTGVFTRSAYPSVVFPNEDGVHPTYGALGDVDDDLDLDAIYTSAENIAYPPEMFAQEQPPVVVTQLINDPTRGSEDLTATEEGTAYVGKGVTPLLADIAPPGPDGLVDRVLVFSTDVAAGLGADAEFATFGTFLALLAGVDQVIPEDTTVDDLAPNQFSTGAQPGDVDGGDLTPLDAGVDLVVPNADDNSLTVLVGDGNCGVSETFTITGVDDNPPGGSWIGGPRAASITDLHGPGPSSDLDVVVYNEWVDPDAVGGRDYQSSFSLFHGDGTGDLTDLQYVSLPRAGELVVGEITPDGNTDVVVTQRLPAGTNDEVRAYPGLASGLVDTGNVDTVTIPGGVVLSGGLALADLVNTGNGLDVVTSAIDEGTGEGLLVVFDNVNGTLDPTPQTFVVVDPAWSEVRSLDVGDVTGEGDADVVLGTVDGRLFVAESDGGGGFFPAVTSVAIESLGGGALRLGDLDLDGVQDVVGANAGLEGQLDQAFVRTVRGSGPLQLGTLPGIASVGRFGALRPALVDMDEDGAVDLVLSHGDSDAVSVIFNTNAPWADAGPGLAGTDDVVPVLTGKGTLCPSGSYTIELTDAYPDSVAYVFAGFDDFDPALPFLDGFLVPDWTASGVILQVTTGPATTDPVTPNAGFGLDLTWSKSSVPGITIYVQAWIIDPEPAMGFSASNAISRTTP